MIRRRIAIGIILFVVCVFVGATWTAAQEKPLDNAEIVKLTKLDMGDAIIIAKIKAAPAVKFDTSTDDLVKLKEAGVSKAVITAMVDRTAGGGAAATTPSAGGAADADPIVTLSSTEGSVALPSMFGSMKSQVAYFGMARWVQFPDEKGKIRIRDRRPSVLIEINRDPRGGWYFVSLSQQKGEDYRYFDLEGGVAAGGAPEKGAVIKVDVVEDRPGMWRITPQRDLKAGAEYGLYSGLRGEGILFGFGIDK